MTPMTPPPMFGIFHISTVLVGTLLAVFFAKRAAKLPKDRIIRLFGILGLIMAFSELVKLLFYYYVVNDRQFDWWIFPFQLCSVPMYLCLLMPLFSGRRRSKTAEKVQNSFCTFLATYSLFGAVMALLWPEDMLRPFLLMTLHGFLWHLLLVFLSLTVIFSGLGDFSVCGFLDAVLLFFGLAFIATLINVFGWYHPSLPGSYPDMFYITPFVMTTQPVVRAVAEAVGIVPANILYLLSISLFAGLLCLAVRRLCR